MHNRTFSDPNKMATDGTVNIGNVSVSKDGNSWLAYEISKGGSDWVKYTLKHLEPKKIGKNWMGEILRHFLKKRFYYSRYDALILRISSKEKTNFIKSIITRLVQNNAWTNLCTWIKNMLWEITAQYYRRWNVSAPQRSEASSAIAWWLKTSKTKVQNGKLWLLILKMNTV